MRKYLLIILSSLCLVNNSLAQVEPGQDSLPPINYPKLSSKIMVTMAPTRQSIFDAKNMWKLDGYKVKEYKGLAMGLAVRTLGVGNEVLVVGKSLVGGKIEKVRKILEQSRREAYSEMLQDAINQGANAVLWAHYEDNPCGPFTEIIWYGNAVVVEPVTN